MDTDIGNKENEQTKALDMLIKDLGIDTLPKEKQEDLIVKMTEVMLKRIFLETMDRLGDEGREAYLKLSEEDEITPEEAEAFFKKRIENYDEMVRDVIVKFKEEMMEVEE